MSRAGCAPPQPPARSSTLRSSAAVRRGPLRSGPAARRRPRGTGALGDGATTTIWPPRRDPAGRLACNSAPSFCRSAPNLAPRGGASFAINRREGRSARTARAGEPPPSPFPRHTSACMSAATGDHLARPLCCALPAFCVLQRVAETLCLYLQGDSDHGRGLARRVQLGWLSGAVGSDHHNVALDRPRRPIGRQARLVALAMTKRPSTRLRSLCILVELPTASFADARWSGVGEGCCTSAHGWGWK